MTSVNLMYKEILIPVVLNPGSIDDLLSQLLVCENENVRFIVLKGNDAVFCNGLDLAWVANSAEGNHIKDMQSYASFLKKLQTGKFISIALVKGIVSGGGMGIVCACDHVIAEETSSYSLPEGLFGLIPGMILPALLNRLSTQRIKKMVLTGKKYPAHAAMEYGIIDEISADHDKALNDAINAMRSCKPGAVSDIKEILYMSHVNKDELSVKGMNVLNTRLQEAEIKQRLQDIVDFG